MSWNQGFLLNEVCVQFSWNFVLIWEEQTFPLFPVLFTSCLSDFHFDFSYLRKDFSSVSVVFNKMLVGFLTLMSVIGVVEMFLQFLRLRKTWSKTSPWDLFIWLSWVFSSSMWNPWPGLNPSPLHWEQRIQATGPPWKSQDLFFLKVKYLFQLFSSWSDVLVYCQTVHLYSGVLSSFFIWSCSLCLLHSCPPQIP